MTWLLQNELRAHQAGLDLTKDRTIIAVTPNTIAELVNQLFEAETGTTDHDSTAEILTENGAETHEMDRLAERYQHLLTPDQDEGTQYDYWGSLNIFQRRKYLEAARKVAKSANENLIQALKEAMTSD